MTAVETVPLRGDLPLRPTGALQRLWQRILYGALHRWIIEYAQGSACALSQRRSDSAPPREAAAAGGT